MMRGGEKICGVVALLIYANAVFSQQNRHQAARTSLPEGSVGIAAKYPGDKGIQNDPDVVFVEDFEGGDSAGNLAKRWDDVSSGHIMSLSGDAVPQSFGKKSLLMTHVGGKGTGGHLYRRLLPGYGQLYFRYYTKIDRECHPIHHFVHFGGYNPPTPWAQGGAGVRPTGDERFSTAIEPGGKRWTWDFYTYWMEMRGSPPRGQTWGNSFIHNPALKAEQDKWSCIEIMVKLNDVGGSNGEMAAWIDGKLVGHLGKGFPVGKWTYDKFMPGQGGASIRWNDSKGAGESFDVPENGAPFDGFRWRNSEALKINFVWMLLYITTAPEGHVSRVGFDQIVVAKKYIGPVK